MTIPAFTNSVGSFRRLTTVERKVYGYTFGGNPVDIVEPYLIPSDISEKSGIIKGDRKHSTPCRRYIASLLVDEPFIRRERSFNLFPPYQLLGELYFEDHISRLTPSVDHVLPPKYWGLLENARSECITEARNRLREGKVQNGADLAQARQTANLLSTYSVGALSSVKKFMRREGLKSLRGLSGSQLTKGLANRYLEMIFGIMPLLTSISDNAELLRQMAEHDISWVIKAQKSKSVEFDSGWERDGSFLYRWVIGGKVKCGYRARITNPLLTSLDTFGVLNPLSISWELMPMSFVLDWFIPVGNVLDSLSATLGLQFEDGYISTRTEGTLSVRHVDGTDIISRGKMETSHLFFNREVLSSFPLPELYSKSNPFSSKRIVTALALLTQRIL